MTTDRAREFLLKLADLCDEYKAEFTDTGDGDGIHITLDGREIFVGWIQPWAGDPLRDAAARLPDA